MRKYNHKEVEKKWKKNWEESGIYKTKEEIGKPKYYVLDMFPYPSGAGLHVGHPKGYIATDIVARMKMMQGFNVLHPMGWDAFGLPAENYALKNKVHPSEATAENVATFKKQLGLLGFTYDWDREVNTTDPKYYKWTQWIFLQMFKRGLAFESFAPINWCPSCQTGLANEDLDGGRCERCGSEIERRPMRQWVLRITDYAEKLLSGLDTLTAWPEHIKKMQSDWIGKSEGALVNFGIASKGEKLLLLHGRNGSPTSHNFPWLKDGLEKSGFTVEVPLLPNTSEPDDLEQAEYVIKNCKLDEQTTLVCHSFGGIVALRLLEKGIKIKRLILVSTPFTGNFLDGKVRESVSRACGRGFNFSKIIKNAQSISVIHDVNDDIVPQSDLDQYTKNLNVPLLKLRGVAPHFCGETEPELLNAIIPSLQVFTTRPDTLFGATYMVIAPEHPFVKNNLDKISNKKEVEEYLEHAKSKSDLERTELQKEKTGVELKGLKAINPVSRAELPIFVADYVLYGYGTGAIMAVPGHDERDWEFAKKYNLPIVAVVSSDTDVQEKPFTDEGIASNSDFINNLSTSEAKKKMITYLEEKNIGKGKVQYKLRDWVFSRQRYWGEPIPLVHCEKDGWVPVPEDQLPLELPKVKNYEPSGTGESPLATIADWVNTTCPQCGGPAKRETNTMPQWAGSCWYYLRYEDPHNDKEFVNKDKEKYWSPIDLYVGGAEHATRHLIYARFWHKFLFDIGAVNYSEPFTRLQNVGLILAEDGRKMSKRWNNVINPDEVVNEYGADAMRLYEMFMGPFDQPCAWSTKGVVGVRRFLERVWMLNEKVSNEAVIDKKTPASLHQTIKKVTEDIEGLRFNTAISAMMELTNDLNKFDKISTDSFSLLVKLLSPFAPHASEELWSGMGNKTSIFASEWPKYDAELAKEDEVTLAIQINGKLRDTILVPIDISEEEVKQKVIASEKVQKWLDGKEAKKIIYVKGKLVSIVI